MSLLDTGGRDSTEHVLETVERSLGVTGLEAALPGCQIGAALRRSAIRCSRAATGPIRRSISSIPRNHSPERRASAPWARSWEIRRRCRPSAREGRPPAGRQALRPPPVPDAKSRSDSVRWRPVRQAHGFPRRSAGASATVPPKTRKLLESSRGVFRQRLEHEARQREARPSLRSAAGPRTRPCAGPRADPARRTASGP